MTRLNDLHINNNAVLFSYMLHKRRTTPTWRLYLFKKSFGSPAHSGLILSSHSKAGTHGWKWFPQFWSKGCGISGHCGLGLNDGHTLKQQFQTVRPRPSLVKRKRKNPRATYCCASIPVTVHHVLYMRLLKVTKTVRSMNRNEDELNRPVYAPRSASNSAMTKPSCIPASRISVHRRDNNENLSWLLYVEWFFHRCPHSLRMGHRPATLLDVLIPGSVMRSRERAGQTQRQCSNGKACRDNIEQVITLQELRQPPVSHCHQKLHLFLMGSFMEIFCLPFIFVFPFLSVIFTQRGLSVRPVSPSLYTGPM